MRVRLNRLQHAQRVTRPVAQQEGTVEGQQVHFLAARRDVHGERLERPVDDRQRAGHTAARVPDDGDGARWFEHPQQVITGADAGAYRQLCAGRLSLSAYGFAGCIEQLEVEAAVRLAAEVQAQVVVPFRDGEAVPGFVPVQLHGAAGLLARVKLSGGVSGTVRAVRRRADGAQAMQSFERTLAAVMTPLAYHRTVSSVGGAFDEADPGRQGGGVPRGEAGGGEAHVARPDRVRRPPRRGAPPRPAARASARRAPRPVRPARTSPRPPLPRGRARATVPPGGPAARSAPPCAAGWLPPEAPAAPAARSALHGDGGSLLATPPAPPRNPAALLPAARQGSGGGSGAPVLTVAPTPCARRSPDRRCSVPLRRSAPAPLPGWSRL